MLSDAGCINGTAVGLPQALIKPLWKSDRSPILFASSPILPLRNMILRVTSQAVIKTGMERRSYVLLQQSPAQILVSPIRHPLIDIAKTMLFAMLQTITSICPTRDERLKER